MIHVAGIDSSLSETGIVVIRGVDGRPIFDHATAPTPPLKNPNAEEELARLRTMASRAFTRALIGFERGDRALFLIEGPSLRSKFPAKADERAGLRWMLLNALAREGRVVEIPPSTLKSYWTGNGSAKKELMVQFAHHRYPEFNLTDDNVVDALALAHLGATHLGLITEPRPPGVNEAALAPIRWPHTMQEAPHDRKTKANVSHSK